MFAWPQSATLLKKSQILIVGFLYQISQWNLACLLQWYNKTSRQSFMATCSVWWLGFACKLYIMYMVQHCDIDYVILWGLGKQVAWEQWARQSIVSLNCEFSTRDILLLVVKMIPGGQISLVVKMIPGGQISLVVKMIPGGQISLVVKLIPGGQISLAIWWCSKLSNVVLWQ